MSKIRSLVSSTQRFPEVEWEQTPPPDTRNLRDIPSVSTSSAIYWAHRSGTIYTSPSYRSMRVDPGFNKAYAFEVLGLFHVVVSDESGRYSLAPVAELIAEVFLLKPSPGQVLGFVDGDRGNCAASNLVWEWR